MGAMDWTGGSNGTGCEGRGGGINSGECPTVAREDEWGAGPDSGVEVPRIMLGGGGVLGSMGGAAVEDDDLDGRGGCKRCESSWEMDTTRELVLSCGPSRGWVLFRLVGTGETSW